MLLQPNKKTMKKLREVLYDLYKHLDSSAASIIDVSKTIWCFPDCHSECHIQDLWVTGSNDRMRVINQQSYYL